MRHSVENYIIFILLFSVNCIILYPKYILWREVAEDGAGNGFRDFVHV